MILGTVPYLNVQPMLWAVQEGLIGDRVEIIPEVPRRLAAALAEGAYDTAIVPVFEYFRHPNLYTYVQGPVIAARGRVQSVMLFSSSPWQELKTVYLDSSSLTSVHLFKVLSAEKGLDLEYLDTANHDVPDILPSGIGWVVIGDPAIAELGRHKIEVDLAFAWQELSGLPFVFAAWLVPEGAHPSGLGALLGESLHLGLQNLERVAHDSATRFGVTEEFALHYFSTCIHYHLGGQELAGWREFGRLCHKHGLIESVPELRRYYEE